MNVLFMMPNWITPSEVWLQRMMKELGKDLRSVVTWDTQGATSWHGRARAVSLNRYLHLNTILSRFGIRITSPQSTLQQEIRRCKITHILCHYGEFALQFSAVWHAIDTPLFVHFHGYDATFDLRVNNHPYNPYFNQSYQKEINSLAQRATLIANSKFTKSLLVAAGIPGDRVHVKYLGVPIQSSGKIHSKREEIHILTLGRLVDFKSPDRTIGAFEIARSKGLKGQLTIAGDGPLRLMCELLRARSLYKDSIRVLGAVSEEQAQALFNDADIYTQHNIKGEISRQEECFGVSIVEAMACGLPVVGTRSGAVVETVVDGEGGFLVDPGNIEGQAEAILRLGKDPNLRQQFGDAGRKRVSEYFSMEREEEQLRLIMGLPTSVQNGTG